ncbi:hypothetical protein EV361DRAFT_956566 [Lentinula raphanica]|nr:hypothetical protein EV361DRAFT_956566 [Lentinula raphanica]
MSLQAHSSSAKSRILGIIVIATLTSPVYASPLPPIPPERLGSTVALDVHGPVSIMSHDFNFTTPALSPRQILGKGSSSQVPPSQSEGSSSSQQPTETSTAAKKGSGFLNSLRPNFRKKEGRKEDTRLHQKVDGPTVLPSDVGRNKETDEPAITDFGRNKKTDEHAIKDSEYTLIGYGYTHKLGAKYHEGMMISLTELTLPNWRVPVTSSITETYLLPQLMPEQNPDPKSYWSGIWLL